MLFIPINKDRAEAKRMSIYEHDQARHIRQEREEAWEEGKQEGMEQERLAIVRRMLEGGTSREEIKRRGICRADCYYR